MRNFKNLLFSIALKLTSQEKENDVRYVVHAIQLEKEAAFVENKFHQYLTMTADCTEPKEFIFKVKVNK